MLMCGIVLAMNRLVMTVHKIRDAAVRSRLLQARLHRWSLRQRVINSLTLQNRASTLAAVVATTTLLFGYGREMVWVLLDGWLLWLPRPRPLLGLSQVDALLSGMMMLARIAAVTADVGRPFLALLPTVLALCHRSALLRYLNKLAI